MIELMSETAGRIVGVRLSGRTTPDDHRTIRRRLQSHLEATEGPVRLLVDLSGFEGQGAGGDRPGGSATDGADGEAHWFEPGLGARIERLALIADTRWASEVARFRTVFTSADIRRFDPSDSVGARAWVANAG